MSSGSDPPPIEVPSASVTEDEPDDGDEFDDRHVIESHVELSKTPCKYSLYLLYIYILLICDH